MAVSSQTVEWGAIIAFAICLGLVVLAELAMERARRPKRRRHRGFRNYKSMHQIARDRARDRRNGFRY
jgi:hypothetical protein